MPISVEDTRNLFKALPHPPNDHLYSASTFPASSHHKIAKNSLGAPLILISVHSSESPANLIPVSLEHIHVKHNLVCRLQTGDGMISASTFSAVHCTSPDPEIQSYFLDVVSSVVLSLGEHPTAKEVNIAMLRLGELFRALTSPPQQSTQGLWAELYFMARIGNTPMLAKAWRQHPEDHFDFRTSAACIDVKSYAGSVRQHHFSLEQLRPRRGEYVIIASLNVAQDKTGVSVGELANEVRNSLWTESDALGRFNAAIARTLGSGLKVGMQECFDDKLAHSSLALFHGADIPSVPRELAPEISNVRFVVDLSHLKATRKINSKDQRRILGFIQ